MLPVNGAVTARAAWDDSWPGVKWDLVADEASFVWHLSGGWYTLVGRTTLYKHWLICDKGSDKKWCGSPILIHPRKRNGTLGCRIQRSAECLTSDVSGGNLQKEGWCRFQRCDMKMKTFSSSSQKGCDTLRDPKLVSDVSRAHCTDAWCGDPVQCSEFKRARQRAENPRASLTCCVSSRALWWMTLIFLSTWDYFYVYLDIFLMGFHLSSTDRTGQDRTGRKGGREGEREGESIRERERARGHCPKRDHRERYEVVNWR